MAGQLLDELIEFAGIQGVIRLCRNFGGRQVYIPENVSETHPLALTIGYLAACELSRRYGRERLAIPAEHQALLEQRNRRIVDEYRLGSSVSKLSRDYGVSRPWVHNILDRSGVQRRSLEPE
jgi:Mor family transcriptional regulator